MGVPGLDDILHGGLPAGNVYLVHGGPGTGKTTLGLHFLREGAGRGERVLYVNLLQTPAELRATVASHGWTLEGIELFEFPPRVREAAVEEQTLFTAEDMELGEAVDAILEAVERLRPQRVVLDSVGELSLLTETPHRLRHYLIKLKLALQQMDCTSVFIMGDVTRAEAFSVETLVHGVIGLSQESPPYGGLRRQVLVTKMRGLDFLGGRHDLKIRTGGLEVYPRTEVDKSSSERLLETVPSGIEELDRMLGGGLEPGTSCLFTGTTGAGKSTVATLYAAAAAERGHRSVVFCFDERRDTFLRRAAGLGMAGMADYVRGGLVDVRQVNVGELSPGEFAHQVRRAVDVEEARIVVIDSVSGYVQSMPGGAELVVQLHELLAYLAGAGALTLLTVASSGLFSEVRVIDTSYLADTVVLLRHFEAMGRVRRCISVLKKRYGPHETTIRELRVMPGGLELGPPLERFSGVLTGVPTYHGAQRELFSEENVTELERSDGS